MLDPDGYGEMDHGHVDEPDDMPGEAFTHATEDYGADPNHGADKQDGQRYDGQDCYEPQYSHHQDSDSDGLI